MASYGGYNGSYNYRDSTGSNGSTKYSERARWTPLTRMLLSGEMTQEKQRELSPKEKFEVWMVNEGYRRMYVMPVVLHSNGERIRIMLTLLQLRLRLYAAPCYSLRLRFRQLLAQG